jgi:3-hydroxyisobutyrate dehydrogenase
VTLAAGFIGLGAMGRGMARNLHRAGLLQTVWNRNAAIATELAAELGVHASASPADLAARCDVVVLCVSADTDVLEIVDALAPALRPGAIVVDCSTVSADTAREAARRLAAKGFEFLDAPVSGGVEGARDGKLAIMVGGSAEALERARPVLAAMGRAVTHFGPSGAGQAAKATNQIMCAGIIQAVAEAMAFAKAEGLPLDRLIETLGQGAGSSWYFVHRAPNMVRDSYPPGFRVRLHEKDLQICRDMAARHGVQLPVIEMTLLHYRRLIEQGHGDEDISTIFRLKDALFSAGGPADGDPPPR